MVTIVDPIRAIPLFLVTALTDRLRTRGAAPTA
jgi:hypothetical protein